MDKAARLAWHHEARYGMFIHWGAYAVAGRGEWVMNRERIGRDEYIEKYVNQWKAENYHPEDWARLAKDAGMKYLVLTTRHHDGFALWPTAATSFNAGNLGPRCDLVGPFVEAVRAAGLRVGLYYSPAAWTHPDYPNPFARDWPGVGDWKGEAARRRFIAYYRQELDELLTRYGKIDLLWYDGCIPANLDGAAANARVRALQPDIVINPRMDEATGDYRVCEQTIRPPTKAGETWEACLTLRRDTWGWHAGDPELKTPRQILEMLFKTCGKAGNLLLNVGPRPDGTIPEDEAAVLRTVGDWLRRNGEWLPNSDFVAYPWNNTALVSARGRTVYLHFMSDPRGTYCWAEAGNKVLSARRLDGGHPVPFRQEGPRVWLDLPRPLPDPLVTTIALEMDGTPTPATPETTFWIPS